MKRKNIVMSLVFAITSAATASYNDLSSALDPGDPTNGGYWNVEERLSKYLPNPEVKSSGSSPIEARAAASAVSAFLSTIDPHPSVVGHNFFMWVDMPAGGLKSGAVGENGNYGLVNSAGEPYRQVVEAFRRRFSGRSTIE